MFWVLLIIAAIVGFIYWGHMKNQEHIQGLKEDIQRGDASAVAKLNKFYVQKSKLAERDKWLREAARQEYREEVKKAFADLEIIIAKETVDLGRKVTEERKKKPMSKWKEEDFKADMKEKGYFELGNRIKNALPMLRDTPYPLFCKNKKTACMPAYFFNCKEAVIITPYAVLPDEISYGLTMSYASGQLICKYGVMILVGPEGSRHGKEIPEWFNTVIAEYRLKYGDDKLTELHF